jgi:hypothetical protein
MPFQLTGTGVTINVNAIPVCQTTAAGGGGVRVVVNQMGATPEYCATLTPGQEIPWASFNTQCWNGMGTSLSGAPNSDAVKIQFVTGAMACDFTDFRLTDLEL